MSYPDFLLILAGGAALLALWLLKRFPDWCPTRLRRAVLHFSFSVAFVWIAGNIIEPAVARGLLLAVALVFLVVLPTLVYSWFSVAWVLRLFHEVRKY